MLETGEIDEKILDQISKSEPIVGYAGFLKGIKSGNEYGKTFNELARTSIRKWEEKWSVLTLFLN